MPTLRQHWKSTREIHLSCISHLTQQELDFAAISTIEGLRDLSLTDWTEPPRIHLYVDPDADAYQIIREILHALKLPTARRDFNAETGKIDWTIENAPFAGKFWLIKMSAIPTACRIEQVEEEVEVPATTEKRIRYRIANPEECLRGTEEPRHEETPATGVVSGSPDIDEVDASL